jgi:hypothetical protein
LPLTVSSAERRGLVNARDALQSLRFTSLAWVLPHQDRTLRIGYSLRVVGLSQYRPYWLGSPTLPLTVSSAVWSSCEKLDWLPLKSPAEPSLEFRLRLESRRVNLAASRSRTAPLLGFHSLQHVKNRRST